MNVDLARWQFAFTSINHFLFVPVTAFILAANSWMQHPVGFVISKKTRQPQLTDIWAVLTKPVFVWGFAHVLLASLVTGAVVMLAVSAWQLRRGGARDVFTRSARLPERDRA